MKKLLNSNPVYYLLDGMGSVIGLADSTGHSTAKFGYDAFGNVRTSQGVGADSTGGDFRFQGQWLESATGLYNFRARDYDSRSGAFLSRDPVDSTAQNPEALNPYQFVYNNPYVYSDPSGMFTLVELNATQNGQDILQAVQLRVRQGVYDYLRDKAKEVVNDLALSALQSIVPIPLKGITNLLENGDKFGAGALWGAVAGKTANSQFKDDPSFLDNIYIEVPVNKKTGKPSGNGANIRDSSVFAMFPERAFELGGNPNDPRPDFIIRPDVPKNTSEPSWVIGDFKLSVSGMIDDYFTIKRKQDQWQAIAQHAANYGYRFAGFFTLWSGTSAENEKVRAEAFKDGTIAVILSVKEKRGFRSPL